ncbi:P-loop containing nucleoside triphosphate hydrolase protein [Gigaspora margarita]|uniref:P-loop containing nucleoside triphosphate hydrolase protein n=1 Tax=Gigaspora margarita TaxID=4874 RepID=A0A8H3X3U1_GIGMA|nr:P-loop containing nucleoside triphosphate hydrolase protein [Gigaspora margarita]
MSDSATSVSFNLTFFHSSISSRDIPYANYFAYFPYDRWSLYHFVTTIIGTYANVEKKIAHNVFYNTLYDMIDNQQTPQEVCNMAIMLTSNKEADIKSVQSLWNNMDQSNRASSPPPQSSSTMLEKRKSVELIDSSNKRQRLDKEMGCLSLNIDVPTRVNGSINILEVLKSAVRMFHQKTISLGSIRSYKRSNRLNVGSEQKAKVPRESVYDAELYRTLFNWLVEAHGYEITSQWHLEGIQADGELNHNFCDLTISKSDTPEPVAILELLATSSISKLKDHFNRVFKYAELLRPLEVWAVHFSREDDVAKKPYWPCRELQERGLNVVHFWHDKDFLNVRMSSKSLDATGEFSEIIDQPILP